MPDSDGRNTLGELMKYLGTPDRPVSSAEFTAFWKSLTEEEKEEYKTAKLN